jgi:gamma-glutamyltranspeptidase/glutathione hydrolase
MHDWQRRLYSTIWACLALLVRTDMAPAAGSRPWLAKGQAGMVASDSIHASRAGIEILKQGGNAVDAATAVSFALAVTRPGSMGLGGGGFLMVRIAEGGRVYVLDYRECAPSASTSDMFVRRREELPDRPPPSQFGGLAVGVPGHVAGHAVMLQRLGTMKFEALLEPARRLAAEGFPIDAHLADSIADTLREIHDQPALRTTADALHRALLFEGEAPQPGAVLRQPALARTLASLQAGGADAFYRGRRADAIAQTVRDHGGIMTAEDLATYQPRWRDPLRITYRNSFEILLMPPPSSGGICLGETLNILEHWDLPVLRRSDPGLAAHLMVEALKYAFADRAAHLGDADFVPVPVERLIGKPYANLVAGRLRENTTTRPAAGRSPPKDDHGTSHFCVVDRWANVVVCTETINTVFGSLLFVEEAGIVLNNEMDDFTAEPGRSNAFGLRQSELNAPAPGKRPLSSMSPTIVLREGEPVLALGAAGGPRIITATLQVLLGVVDDNQPLPEAILKPRLHHQWQPDVVYRNDFPADGAVISGLKHRGHIISDLRRGAKVNAVEFRGQRLFGVSDPHKGGRPSGY